MNGGGSSSVVGGKRKRKHEIEEEDTDDYIGRMLSPLKFVRISSESEGSRFPLVDAAGEPSGRGAGLDYSQANAVLRELAIQRELRAKLNAAAPLSPSPRVYAPAAAAETPRGLDPNSPSNSSSMDCRT
jgi:hypothetical protein